MNRPGPADPAARAPKATSLRRRLLLLSIVVLALSLGIVGVALNSAFLRSAEADIAQQMETWSYLVLGATEVGREA
ncbi:MAG: hypothetical protein HKO64_11320 [Xanthomonadales bacterium]|nr:hypothetical protein [Xanthomonadales bacterium]